MTWTNLLDAAEAGVIALARKLGPWLITGPTAYAIYDGVMTRWQWPRSVAVLTGAGLEVLGVVTTYTMLELFSYNQAISRPDDPKRPTWLAGAATVIYLAATLTLTWGIEGDWMLALFPLLNVSGSLILALSALHRSLQARLAGTVEAEKRAQEVAEAERKINEKRAQEIAEAAVVANRLAQEAATLAQIEAQKQLKLARIAAKVAKQSAEVAPAEIASEAQAGWLGWNSRPTKDAFLQMMLARNGTAPTKSETMRGLATLDVPEATRRYWWNEYEVRKSAAVPEVEGI